MARVKHSRSSVVDANPVANGNVLQPPSEQQTQISASIVKKRGSEFSSIFAFPGVTLRAFLLNKSFGLASDASIRSVFG
jgi:hypothetical protein